MRTVKVGEPFEIELGEALSAGYAWRLTNDGEPGWRLVSRSASRPQAMGEERRLTYRFEMLRPGTSCIRLDLVQPWEEEAEERLIVEVQALPAS